MTVTWQAPPERVWPELSDAYIEAIQDAVWELCRAWAPAIEAWMKRNAVWTDRTGNARQTLWSDVFRLVEAGVLLILSHGMDYGEHLELNYGGTYAIIGPALDYFAPLIWADILALFSR